MSNKIFVDTNIFIEVYIREGPKSDKCLKLLEKTTNLITSWTIIAEVEWILRSFYKYTKSDIISVLQSILSFSGLKINNRPQLLLALSYFQQHNIDWVDCLNIGFCQKESINKIYSYDKHFNKLKPLTRLEPWLSTINYYTRSNE